MTPRQGQKKGQGQAPPPFRVATIEGGVFVKLDGTPEGPETAKRDAAATKALAAAGVDPAVVSAELIRAHRKALKATNTAAAVARRVGNKAAATKAAIQNLLESLDCTDPAITPLLKARNALGALAERRPAERFPWLASVADAVVVAVFGALDRVSKADPSGVAWDESWGTRSAAAEITRLAMLAAYPADAVKDRALTVEAIRKRHRSRPYQR